MKMNFLSKMLLLSSATMMFFSCENGDEYANVSQVGVRPYVIAATVVQ